MQLFAVPFEPNYLVWAQIVEQPLSTRVLWKLRASPEIARDSMKSEQWQIDLLLDSACIVSTQMLRGIGGASLVPQLTTDTNSQG